MSRIKIFLMFFSVLLTTYNLQLTASYADTDIVVVEKLFMEGRYERVVSEARRMIDGRARRRDEIYYLKGSSELKLKQFEEARHSFEEIISKYANSNRVFDAYVGIGDSYLLEGNIESAVKSYNGIKEKFPDDKNIALVDSRLSECRKGSPVPPPVASVVMPGNIPQNESKDYISVQAGCFKNRRNADALSAKLASRGYQSYVELPLSTGDRLYRVKVGRLKSKIEADDIAAKLRRDGYKTKVCF